MQNSVKQPKHRYDLILASADYPARLGPPARSLIICTQQRSGSTLLGEAIYFARGLGCPLEYFHSGLRPQLQSRWASADLRAYVANLHLHRTDTTGVFSVKLFWRDVIELVRELAPAEFGMLSLSSAAAFTPADHRRMFAIISEFLPNPTFVFLVRRDNMQQAVSFYVASQTGQWRDLFERKTGDGAARPAYSFDEIVRLLAVVQKHNADWIDFFRANDLMVYEVVYEDIVKNYDATLRKFFDAVGRRDATITAPRLRKQANDYSDELLERFLAEFRQRARS